MSNNYSDGGVRPFYVNGKITNFVHYWDREEKKLTMKCTKCNSIFTPDIINNGIVINGFIAGSETKCPSCGYWERDKRGNITTSEDKENPNEG